MGQLSSLHSKLLLLRLDARRLASTEAELSAAEAHKATSRKLARATQDLWRALNALHGKANFNPNQPRVPRGNPDGGQWTDDSAFGGGPESGRLRTGRASTNDKPPGGETPGVRVTITPRPEDLPGGAGLAPENLPEIPRERPPTAKGRHTVVKNVARWGARIILRGTPIGHVMTALEIGHWLYEEFSPYIEAYWEEPKTLEELQKNATRPARGYQIHHIR